MKGRFVAVALFMDLGVRILGVRLNTYHSIQQAAMSVFVVMAAIIIWQIYSVMID